MQERSSSFEFFSTLRSVISLLSVAPTDDLTTDNSPAVVRRALDEHRRTLQANSEERQSLVVAGEDHRKGPRFRAANRTPTNPNFLAALLPAAVVLSDDLTAPEAEVLLENVANELKRRVSSTTSYMQYVGLPTRLAERMRAITSNRFTVSRTAVNVASTDCSLKPENVPQMFWNVLYQRHFAAILDPMRLRTGRRAVSLTLTRSLLESTWEEAGAYLGHAPELSTDWGNAFVTFLRSREIESHFQERLATALVDISALTRVDWRARRQVFNKTTVTDENWIALCAASELSPGRDVRQRAANRRSAGVWIWAELTGNDEHCAPAWAHPPTGPELDVHGRWVQDHLPTFRHALVGWVEARVRSAFATPPSEFSPT